MRLNRKTKRKIVAVGAVMRKKLVKYKNNPNTVEVRNAIIAEINTVFTHLK